MTGERQTVWPAVDPMGQAWMDGDVSAEEWFSYVRTEAAASAAQDEKRARVLGNPAVTAQVEA